MGTALPMGSFSTGVRVDWGLSQRPVRVDGGRSHTTGQATIAQSGLLLERRVTCPSTNPVPMQSNFIVAEG